MNCFFFLFVSNCIKLWPHSYIQICSVLQSPYSPMVTNEFWNINFVVHVVLVCNITLKNKEKINMMLALTIHTLALKTHT